MQKFFYPHPRDDMRSCWILMNREYFTPSEATVTQCLNTSEVVRVQAMENKNLSDQHEEMKKLSIYEMIIAAAQVIVMVLLMALFRLFSAKGKTIFNRRKSPTLPLTTRGTRRAQTPSRKSVFIV